MTQWQMDGQYDCERVGYLLDSVLQKQSYRSVKLLLICLTAFFYSNLANYYHNSAIISTYTQLIQSGWIVGSAYIFKYFNLCHGRQLVLLM